MLRRAVSFFAVFLALAGLSACGSRPSVNTLTPVGSAGSVASARIFTVTTRQPSKKAEFAFTSWRANELSYGAFDIAFPPNHQSGKIEWPSAVPGDPAKDMVVADAQILEKQNFLQKLTAQSDGRVVVFVHGYNSSFQEALFRLAEMKQDSHFPGAAVAFAWPSRATLTGYVADRESANYSRDYFEGFLDDLARTPGVKQIAIVAHSMGNWLTMETLRQARLRGNAPLWGKLDEVVLMSPDIDIDVFRKQMDVIGRLKKPMTVLISGDDVALNASQRIAGDVPRVGNARADDANLKSVIEKYNLRVLDLSNVDTDDSLKHSKFTSILPQLRSIAAQDGKAGEADPFTRTGLFVLDTAGNILKAPGEILQSAPQ